MSAVEPLHIRFKLALAYFSVAVCLGVYMGASENFTLMPVHAHLNLLGWVSQALIAFLFRMYPGIENSGLAKAQFWIYNTFVPAMLLVLAFFLLGNKALGPVIGICSVGSLIGVLLVPITLWRWKGAA